MQDVQVLTGGNTPAIPPEPLSEKNPAPMLRGTCGLACLNAWGDMSQAQRREPEAWPARFKSEHVARALAALQEAIRPAGRDAIAHNMRALAAVYRWPKADTPQDEAARAVVYFEALGDLPPDILRLAVMRWALKDTPWMPTPGQLRETITDVLARRRQLFAWAQQAAAAVAAHERNGG